MTSPGIAGTYARLARYVAATLRRATARRLNRAAHNATARCHCGTCQR